MSFKSICSLVICSLLLLMTACSDPDKETELVDLFTTASQDLISINFPASTTEDIVSINTFVDYKIEGLKSNGVDIIPVSSDISWSLSAGAASTIDNNGRLSTGSVAENITINAKVGYLTTSQDVFVSAAKFDQVIKLNEIPVSVNMCQATQLKPIGSYLNEDGSEEIRPVDNTVINSITWLIRNQEDDTPSQRAYIKTENDITMLQTFETGNVIIQAKAESLSSGDIVTSGDFGQAIDNNLNSFKLCLKGVTDLAACTLDSADVTENGVVSIIAVGNYQASDGTNYNQNISAYSKWGIDFSSFASIAFSADRQWLDVTGKTTNTIANVTSACGNIIETISDSDIIDGVVLGFSVTCLAGDVNCLRANTAINVTETTVTSLDVTANGFTLEDNVAFVFFSSSPLTIVLNVTANYSDGTSEDVTTDVNVVYNNRSPLVLLGITGSPGEYNVISFGQAELQILFQSQVFIAKMTIP